MEKLLKSLDKYLSYHMPQYIEKKNYAEAHEDKDGNVSIVFWSAGKRLEEQSQGPSRKWKSTLPTSCTPLK